MMEIDEILSKLRCNQVALAHLSELCSEGNLDIDAMESDTLVFLSNLNLIEVKNTPMAPIVGSGSIAFMKKCYLTDLGDDVCSVLMDNSL